MNSASFWVQIVAAGIAAFTQIWAVIHGQPVDPSHVAVGAAMATNAYHLHATGGK